MKWFQGIAASTAMAFSIWLLVGPQEIAAHTGATGIVKERMDAMSSIERSIKALAGMARGKITYNADEARAHARSIGAASGQKMSALFPKGTTHTPSEAKPEIWQEWDKFNALADRLAKTAEQMEQAATDNGPSSQFSSALKEMAATCADCHRPFRSKKK